MAMVTSLYFSATSVPLCFVSLSVWVTLPISTKRSGLSSRPYVSLQTVTLTSLDILLISETISFISLSVWVTLPTSTQRSRLSNKLSASLQMVTLTSPHVSVTLRCQFERLGDIANIDEAITAQQQAVRCTPDGHYDKPRFLNNLGASFCSRLIHHHDDTTFAQAIDTYSQSAKSLSGPPSRSFAAARIWATLCFSVHSNETIDAYSALIDLLPHIVWLGRTVEQWYKDISTLGDAVTDAAAAAIHFRKFDLALARSINCVGAGAATP
jgi:hypothetical protein